MPRNRFKSMGKIAVIGYGSQGRAIALNLKDSGYDIIVGLPKNSKSVRIARKEGIKYVTTVQDAVKQADIVGLAFPDYLHGRVYDKKIAPYLKRGASLLFLHGFSIHYGFVKAPKSGDVILIAPHAPGVMVREKYLTDRSLSAFYAVHQNASGKANGKIMELAKALGFEKKRLLKTTFETETIGDLFGEQAVLCGGTAALIKNGFEVLIQNGLPPEHAYLEVAYQLDQIVALIKNYGIEGMFSRISVAAQLGSAKTGPYLIDKSVKKRMENKFRDIKSGSFARELNALNPSDIKKLKSRLKKLTHPRLEKAARRFSPGSSKR